MTQLRERALHDTLTEEFVTSRRLELAAITDELEQAYNNSSDESFFTQACASPEHLATAITFLVNDGNERTKSFLADFINQRLPAFIKQATSEDTEQIYFHAQLAQTLALCMLKKEAAMPKNTIKLLDSITWDFNPEREIPILMAISTKTAPAINKQQTDGKIQKPTIIVSKNGLSIIGIKGNGIQENGQQEESPVSTHLRKVDEKLNNFATKLKNARLKGQFSESNLRLVSVALGFDHWNITGFESPSKAVENLREAATRFLDAFINCYTKPRGYKEGIDILVNAFDKASTYTTTLLAGLAAHRFSVNYETTTGQKDVSLEPLVLELLNSQESRRIDKLVEKSTLLLEETPNHPLMFTNLMVAEIVKQNRLTQNHQLILSRSFILYLKQYGLVIDDISDEELLDMMRGKKIISLPAGGEQLEITLYDIDKDPSTGRVIGHFQEPQQEAEPVTIFEETTSLTTEPEPTLESVIADVLEKAGIKREIPDYVIEALISEIGEVGKDLHKDNLLRTRTFNSGGNTLRFEENPLGTAADKYPNLSLKHCQPHWINNTIFSSDISGTFSLGPNLTFDFVIDKDGHPQGNIDKLFDQGLVSWAQIWQIKYRITALCHKSLISSQEELASRRADLAHRANREIGVDRKKKTYSKNRLEEKLQESREAVDRAYWEWSMQPKDDENDEVDERSKKKKRYIKEELDEIDEIICRNEIEDMEMKGETTKEVWRQLDHAAMERAKQEARGKGHRVKKKPKTGYLIFFRDNRRPTEQAIENAAENGIGLVKVILISKTPAGNYDKVVTRSTFVSSRERDVA